MLMADADEHVKSAIVEGLRRRGMDVVTAQERRQRQTEDAVLLESATADGRLLLTNDTDFLRIHAEWMAAGREHSGIVYWPQGRTISEVIRRVHQYAINTDRADAACGVHFV
jgi:hypothetical protein